MAASKPSHSARPPWHHGTLLPALIEAADEIVQAEGASAVTFREVASRVKKGNRAVSPTAALSHVGSMTELLAHVALRWWRMLADGLAAGTRGLAPDERLVLLGLAYRRFAVEHPRQFRLMYEERFWRAIGELPEMEPDAEPHEPPSGFKSDDVLRAILSARDAAYALFAMSVVDGQLDGSLRSDLPVHLQARLVASLSHGLAMEALDEGLAEFEAVHLVELAVAGLRLNR